MRTLTSLLKEQEAVWIYCESEDLQKKFLQKAEEEGFLARNGSKPTELSLQKFYGINSGMTMGYISNLIWFMSFQCGVKSHPKIDYGKFLSGEEDYLCHRSHIKSVKFEFSDEKTGTES